MIKMNKLVSKAKHYLEVVAQYVSIQLMLVLTILDIGGYITFSSWIITLILIIVPIVNAGIQLLIVELEDDEEEDMSPDSIDEDHCHYLVDRGLYAELQVYIDSKQPKHVE